MTLALLIRSLILFVTSRCVLLNKSKVILSLLFLGSSSTSIPRFVLEVKKTNKRRSWGQCFWKV